MKRTLGVLLVSVLLISTFIALNVFPVQATTSNRGSLIDNLTTLYNKVNWGENWETIYLGNIWGTKTTADLQQALDDCQDPYTIFGISDLVSKLGIENKEKIEWALDNTVIMANGLPKTGSDGKDFFAVSSRVMLDGYYWAAKYNYDTSKWDLRKAYNSFKAAIANSPYPAALFIHYDNTPFMISYGPRYYDEAGETVDVFVRFYDMGVKTALDDALNTWNWINNNLWSVDHYNYALNWAGYECEAGGFYDIIYKLANRVDSLPNSQRILTDLQNRFLSADWGSPQWTYDGTKYYVVLHHSTGNSERRLPETIMAWAAIYAAYGNLGDTSKTTFQSMLTGFSQYEPAWSMIMNSAAGLYDSNTKEFTFSSNSGPTNEATAYGVSLMFMLGIVPNTAVLAIPLRESYYEDLFKMFDPELFNINLQSHTVTVSILKGGSVTFQFNNPVQHTFSNSGIYTVAFDSNWNSIISVNYAGSLPTNRVYMSSSSQSTVPTEFHFDLIALGVIATFMLAAVYFVKRRRKNKKRGFRKTRFCGIIHHQWCAHLSSNDLT